MDMHTKIQHPKTWRATLAWAAGLALTLAFPGVVPGQGFTNLHQFSSINSQLINSDGAYPGAAVIWLSNTLYGTTLQGGAAGGGTIFQVNGDGTGFKLIHSFTPPDSNAGVVGDGAYPLDPVTVAGTTLFGTTSAGGRSDNGIVFKVNLDGSGFATLHGFSATDPNTFGNSDGAAPWAGLVLSGTTLYGTATRGGDAGSGTIFKLNTDGTGFSRIHSFSALDPVAQTNSDGAYPLGGLVISGNSLYGTTYRGGSVGTGTVFRVNIDGSGFTVLHHADGGPRATLLLVSNVLYGTTEGGGALGGGTVFRLNTDGSGFTNVQSFAGSAGDGPWAGLLLSGTALYGTTFGGGDFGQGSAFSLQLDCTSLSNVYSFTGAGDGAQPQGGLAWSDGNLYGTTSGGGNAASGTVFRLVPGQSAGRRLTLVVSGANVILSWPAKAAGLVLQSAISLVPPVSWTPVTPGPVVVNGQNTVTNSISGTQRFYRLSP